tara:strand:- start:155 stop:628 length:474 start_codon:yes stop_codon:yes gene_type:complete
MTKKVLFVCLGNICRSPAAEAVLLHFLKLKKLEDNFVVDSAGTGGWHVGRNADQRMQAAALKRGIKINSKARQITLNDFDEFDLILTMDDANLADVNALSKDLGKPFHAKIKALMSFANNTSVTEVPDPYYGGSSGFDEVLDFLEDAINGLLDEIRN